MIDVKQAVQSASKFIVELYPEKSVSDVRLEEVEISEEGKHWLITLSFSTNAFGTANFIFAGSGRQYKIFKVDADTGEVLSMKIRDLKNEAA